MDKLQNTVSVSVSNKNTHFKIKNKRVSCHLLNFIETRRYAHFNDRHCLIFLVLFYPMCHMYDTYTHTHNLHFLWYECF